MIIWKIVHDTDIHVLIMIKIINEIFIQDVHFSVMYIAVNMYPVKINDYKLINKIKNGFLNVKMILYAFFKYQEAILKCIR